MPVFFFDLASPYSYLASTRVEAMLGTDVLWRPILVGALHRHYRRPSWGATPALRAAGIAEIEDRARAYGLPQIAWPDPYPANSLLVMRGTTWADQLGEARAFARAAFSMAFVEGIDLTPHAAVLEVARQAGLESARLEAALEDPQLKQALRTANDDAIAQGVYGVPTIEADGLLWWGDHLLPAAAAALGGEHPGA